VTKKDVLYLFISLFFLNSVAIAQDIQKEQQPLIVILEALESKFNISFSFADEAIKDKQIIPPDDNLSLPEVLKYLGEATRLEFEVLDNRFVAIKTESKNENEIENAIEILPEVVISNYLTSGIVKDNTGSIIIKPNAFGILPGLIEPDVLQTIQALPGILSVDETVSNINVRAGTNDQNLLLWDAIKM